MPYQRKKLSKVCKKLLKKYCHYIRHIILMICLAACDANAQVIDSKFYRWIVYELQDYDFEEKMCYIVAKPLKSSSDHAFRSKPYLMITRFQDKRTEEITVYSGFEYKLNSEVYISIGGGWGDGSESEGFRLFTKQDKAWSKTKSEDAQIINTILRSRTLKVRSDSSIGKYAVDEYSLKGVTRAYARMREICK